MKTIKKREKSRALTGGLPQCLTNSGTSAFNVISGCSFACRYCKYRARQQGLEQAVIIYTRLADQVIAELSQLETRGQLPRMILFNTTTDGFCGLKEVNKIAAACLEAFFARGIYVNLTTKGLLPDEVIEVLIRHSELVTVTGTVAALSESFASRFEPHVPPAPQRLAILRRLLERGVPVRGRIEPLIPMENDGERDIMSLLELFRRSGLKEVVVSYLQLDRFTRPHLKQRIGAVHYGMLKPWYEDSDGVGRFLSDKEYRLKKYNEIKKLGTKAGVRVMVCACRNADLYTGRCFVMPAQLNGPQKTLL
jgi:DNA repair photolyase